MSFIVDVFFEMLAMLLGLIGIICAFAGVVVTILGVLLSLSQVTDFLLNTFDLNVTESLPSWFGWILGVMVVIVGILMMSLSSVMRKRISHPGR